MHQLKKNAGLFLLALFVTNCTTVSMVNDGHPTAYKVDGTNKFYLFGLVGNEKVHTYDMCPQGVYKVRERFEASDVVLSILTLGIYAPRSYQVTCKAVGESK